MEVLLGLFSLFSVIAIIMMIVLKTQEHGHTHDSSFSFFNIKRYTLGHLAFTSNICDQRFLFMDGEEGLVMDCTHGTISSLTHFGLVSSEEALDIRTSFGNDYCGANDSKLLPRKCSRFINET